MISRSFERPDRTVSRASDAREERVTPGQRPRPNYGHPHANNLIKRVKRVAFGFTNFNNYRIRALLYAGKPDWALLDTLTPP